MFQYLRHTREPLVAFIVESLDGAVAPHEQHGVGLRFHKVAGLDAGHAVEHFLVEQFPVVVRI